MGPHRRASRVVVLLLAISVVAGTGVSTALTRAEAAAPPSPPPPAPLPAAPEPAAPVPDDALAARVLGELDDFTAWLREHRAEGYVGEVGWPAGDQRWQGLAEAWYQRADDAGLWVTAWAAGEWWPTGSTLLVYGSSQPAGPVDTPLAPAAVVEAHLGAAGGRRGVNLCGAEFGAVIDEPASQSFSSASPGVDGRSYHYDGQATFDFLASRGVGLVRLPVRWERLQPRPFGPLDRAELARLQAALGRAADAGVDVVVDLHNYGAVYLDRGGVGVRTPLGSPELPAPALADVWRRLAEALADEPAVAAWGLMNEPDELPGGAPAWEEASQLAVDAIRGTGDRRTIAVAGYDWSSLRTWRTTHPTPWIDDPAGAVRYEAHHYWDADGSGRYRRPYDAEVAAAG